MIMCYPNISLYVQILGLVDSSSEEDWERLAPGFHSWFSKNKAGIFKENMIAPVRERAQLGSPPSAYTTNANESKNFVLKKWVDFQKNSIPDFIEGLREYTQRCLTEAERAVYGAGEYSLSQEYKHLEVSLYAADKIFYYTNLWLIVIIIPCTVLRKEGFFISLLKNLE